MVFEYQEIKTCTASIEVEDIGNCCLISRNLIGEERYLMIKTDFGSTQVILYGPNVPDIDQLPMSVIYSYNRYDFNDRKIIKTIQNFIADADQVEVTDFDTIKENVKNLIDHLEEYS